MPDLAAVYDAGGISGHEELLRAVEAVLAPTPGFRIVSRSESCFAAVNVLKPFSYAAGQPFLQDNDSLLIDGALYDDRPFDELISILFSARPRDLKTLNGQFNAVIYRPSSNELAVITDRLGFRPLYVAKAGTRFAVSSEIKGVRAALKRRFEIDPVGLMELLAFGHNIGDRTLLDGVTVLPPASVVTVGAQGINIVRYDQISYSRSRENLSASPRDLGERIATCVKAIAPRYLAGSSRKAMFLSGGLDSRIVAGATAHVGGRPKSYTFGEPDSRDVDFAQRMAKEIGFSHEVLTFPNNYLSHTLSAIVSRNECAAPFFHASSVIFHDAIARDSDTILVGFCGDVLSGGHLKREMLHELSRIDISNAILRRALCSGASSMSEVLQHGFFKRHWPDFMVAFRASVACIEEESGADTADVWDMQNRQRRFTFSAPKVDRHRFEVIAPLLDRDFIEVMTSVPIKARWKQLAYRYAIVDGFPALVSVPWTKTGRPVPRGRAGFWASETRRFGSKLYSRTLGQLGHGHGFQKDQYKDVAAGMRKDERLFADFLYPRLSNGVLSEEIFNSVGIRRLVDAHMAGEDHSHLLGTILTVAEYLANPEGCQPDQSLH